MTWIELYLAMAKTVSKKSKDPGTKCGAVLVGQDNRVISVGYNGFPAGMHDDPVVLADREQKLNCTIHAEMNALLSAKQDVRGATLYTWPFMTCHRCAAHMIQAGVREVVYPAPPEGKEHWRESFDLAKKYYLQVGVLMREVVEEEQEEVEGDEK